MTDEPDYLTRNKLLLTVVGPVVPDLSGKVAAEEASYLFDSRIPTVEESARGEVVEFTVYAKLPIGDD